MTFKIAILGAGFSGLATAWLLSQDPYFQNAEITIFDPLGVGQGTSGVSAGLLHPFTGAHSKLNRNGREGYAATKKLLEVASLNLGTSVFSHDGVLRLAISDLQDSDFHRCAENYDDVFWYDIKKCQEIAPGCIQKPGIFISCGISVNSSLYLKGLWKGCEEHGVKWITQNVHSLKELEAFDTIVCATGAYTKNIHELSNLSLNCIKGQILELSWPAGCPYPTMPLNSHVYLIANKNSSSCIIGATFEKDFSSPKPDLHKATLELLPKACELYPQLVNSQILDCRAGVRSSTPNHLPLISHLEPNIWIITGMGSKGLLYHALASEELIRKIKLII